jgi:hypothetical protein
MQAGTSTWLLSNDNSQRGAMIGVEMSFCLDAFSSTCTEVRRSPPKVSTAKTLDARLGCPV